MSSLTEELTSLKALLDQGVITQEEFDAKKTQILTAPSQSQQPTGTVQQTEEESTFGWAVLGFFFPLIGLILYLVWKDTKPQASKSAGKGALIGVIVGVVFTFLSYLLIGCTAAMSYSYR